MKTLFAINIRFKQLIIKDFGKGRIRDVDKRRVEQIKFRLVL
jgi:hypothetical protein